MKKRSSLSTPLGPGEIPLADAALRYAHDPLLGTDLKKVEGNTITRILRCDIIDDGIDAEEPLELRSLRPLRGSHRAELRKRIVAWSRRVQRSAPQGKPLGGFVQSNLALLATLFNFDATDRALFDFIVVAHASPLLQELVEAYGNVSLSGAAALVSAATHEKPAAVLRALRSGRTARSGLLEVSRHPRGDLTDRLVLKDGLLDLLLTPGLDRAAILSRFLPPSPASALEWTDFAPLHDGASAVRELLAGALRTHARGVNVLLYGATGTGKTQLARLLATRLGATLHAAGTEDWRPTDAPIARASNECSRRSRSS